MGITTRHSGSPFSTSEELHGTEDLEVDVRNLFNTLNGGLDDANFVAAAAIDVDDKFADLSIPGSKFGDAELTTAKQVAAAVTRHYVDLATAEVVDTADTDWHDVAGITESNHVLTADQFVLMDFEATIDQAASGFDTISVAFALEGTVVSPVFTQKIGGNVGSLHVDDRIIRGAYGYLVTSDLGGTGKNHKPQLKVGSAHVGDTIAIHSAVFRLMILPGLPEGTPGSGR